MKSCPDPSRCGLSTYQGIARELNNAALSLNYSKLYCKNPVTLSPETYVLRKIFLEREVKHLLELNYRCASQKKCAI